MPVMDGMKNEAMPMPMHTAPPAMYQTCTPRRSATGPATARPNGEIRRRQADHQREHTSLHLRGDGRLQDGHELPVRHRGHDRRQHGARDRHPEHAGRRHAEKEEAEPKADEPRERREDAAAESAPHAQRHPARDDADAECRAQGGQMHRLAAKVFGHQDREQRDRRGQKKSMAVAIIRIAMRPGQPSV